MATDKCMGCQSFCMRGCQLAGTAPEQATDEKSHDEPSGEAINYKNGWTDWDGLKKDDTIQSSGGTTKKGLTAADQNQLINFIKATYSEGVCNCQNNLNGTLSEVKDNTTISDSICNSYDNFFSPENTAANSNDVIESRHYNNFTGVLRYSAGYESAISNDPNNKKNSSVTQKHEGINSGVIAGHPESPIIYVTSYCNMNGETTSIDSKSLISAEKYNTLCEKAKHLLYHPHQCNLCNIFEGGEWLEVVKETKIAHGTACAAKNPPYDQGGYVTITSNGQTFTSRQDCSGFVAACLYAYRPDIIPSSAPSNWATPNMGGDQSLIAECDFTWMPGDQGSQPGDIQVNTQSGNAGHTQVIAEDTSMVYNCGGDSSARETGPTKPADHRYDGVWRDNGGSSTGGGGGFSRNIDIDKVKPIIPSNTDTTYSNQDDYDIYKEGGRDTGAVRLNAPFALQGPGDYIQFGQGLYVTVYREGYYNLDGETGEGTRGPHFPTIALVDEQTHSYIDISTTGYIKSDKVHYVWVRDAFGEHPAYVMEEGHINFTDYKIYVGRSTNGSEINVRCDLSAQDLWDIIHPEPEGAIFETGPISGVDLENVAAVSTCEIGGATIEQYRIYISAMANRVDYYYDPLNKLHNHQTFWSTPASSKGYFADKSFNKVNDGYNAAYQAAIDVYQGGWRYAPRWVNTNDAWHETSLSQSYSPSNLPPIGTRYHGVGDAARWVGTAYFYAYIKGEVIGGTDYPG